MEESSARIALAVLGLGFLTGAPLFWGYLRTRAASDA